MTFSPVFPRTFSPTFDRRNANAGAWWNLSGKIPLTSCVAAYQPKGAADQSSSYINLVNPGTYDCTLGTAPTWDATNGWIGSFTAYLKTGITPGIGWSFIVRYTDANNAGDILGCRYSASNSEFGVRPVSSTTAIDFKHQGITSYPGGATTSGVLAVAAQNGYTNGSLTTTITTATNTAWQTIYILAYNRAGTAAQFFTGKIQAVAIYNDDQSSNIAALTTAINAL